ncbi:hypothetical protein TIFTF001_007960 [Ficus carica]|uniref:Uncharacterized protein n=1 Tax=Ficus carica TaxID=3494 RepID=A0AA88D050_FICCA|nr:hypothetical protein TIFTF001_007960 [Ficus carica]
MRRVSPKLAVTTALPRSIGDKSGWSGHGKEVGESDVGGVVHPGSTMPSPNHALIAKVRARPKGRQLESNPDG